MDFWSDGNENECEKCGYVHDLHGHGSYNEVTEKWTYYLCGDCVAAEAAEIADHGIDEPDFVDIHAQDPLLQQVAPNLDARLQVAISPIHRLDISDDLTRGTLIDAAPELITVRRKEVDGGIHRGAAVDSRGKRFPLTRLRAEDQHAAGDHDGRSQHGPDYGFELIPSMHG